MSWRVVTVTGRCKLENRLGYLEELYLHCTHCGMKLLMLENSEREKLSGERVLISDSDKCEFFL